MKRDINLLPAKKSGSKRTTGIIIALVVTFFYVTIFGIAIIVPKTIRDGVVFIRDDLQKQIDELTPQLEEYEEVKTQLEFLRTTMESTGSIEFSKYKVSDALDIIVKTCPTGVMIDRISVTEMSIMIDFMCEDNYQIAQFALELERTGDFQAISISGSSPADVVEDEEERQTGGNAVRSSIILIYDLTLVDDLEELQSSVGGASSKEDGVE